MTTTTADVLRAIPPDLLSPSDLDFLLGATSSRDGFLLRNAPSPSEADRRGAWESLVGACAPGRMSVGVLMLRPAVRDAFERSEALCERLGIGMLVRHSEPSMRWNIDYGGKADRVLAYVQRPAYRAALEITR